MKKLEQILKEDKYDITKDPKAEELIYYLNGKYVEQPKAFKFRVEKDLTDVE